MRSFCFLIFILVSAVTVSSGTGNPITWEKLFSNKNSDVFRHVAEIPSGGYILAGYTSDSTVNDSDAFVVRMNDFGDTLWTKRINGSNSRKDLFYKVINTADGGFAFCGYSSNSGAGNDDAWYLKMDGSGNVQWSKYWGGAGKDRAQDIIQTPDGGYAITGYTTSPPAAYYDAFLIKTNSAGDTLWSRMYGSAGYDDANSVVLMPDSGFVLAGQSTNGSSGLDVYMVRTNLNGDTLWTSRFGTTATDNAEQIIRQSDGTFIIAGGTDNAGFGGNDGLLMMTDSGGALLWSKQFGGNSQDDFHEVFKTTDGGFILSGTSKSSGALEPNMWLVKTNATGDSLWTRTYGGNNHDHGYSAVQTTDGGYIFAGYSGSFGFNGEDAYVVKTDDLGNIFDFLTYGTVFSVVQPGQTYCANSNVQVKVLVRNYGRDTIPNLPVQIQITGPVSATINQTYAGAIFPGEVDTLTFLTPVDLSTPGQYTFTCVGSVLNDVYPQNNSLVSVITVNPVPSVNLGADTVTINTGQSTTLDAGPGFTTYSWSTGATTQTVSVSTTGMVLVTVSNASGCFASDSVYVNVVVGLNNLAENTRFNVWPNPSTGRFELSVDKVTSASEIRILNTIGEVVYTENYPDAGRYKKEINLGTSENGVYFLQLLSREGMITKPIVIFH